MHRRRLGAFKDPMSHATISKADSMSRTTDQEREPGSSRGAIRFHPAVPLSVFALLAVVALVASAARRNATPTLAKDAARLGLDPNRATWSEWCVMPGIGPSRAKAIVDYRESLRMSAEAQSGPVAFRSPRDLMRVRGLGAKSVASLEPWLIFAAEPVHRPGVGDQEATVEADITREDEPTQDGLTLPE